LVKEVLDPEFEPFDFNKIKVMIKNNKTEGMEVILLDRKWAS